jgi:hypothetical protein
MGTQQESHPTEDNDCGENDSEGGDGQQKRTVSASQASLISPREVIRLTGMCL